jgi:hypothetical protein
VDLQVIQPEVEEAWNGHLRWEHCTRCDIGRFAIEHVLFRGTVPCDLLFVGEAPGQTEDAVGYPFVGRSGKLLDEWIADAGVTSYAITNTVACRPCGGRGTPNRAPQQYEKQNCRPRLLEFISEVAKPKLIITVGKHAYQEDYPGFRVEGIAHPAHALYNGGRGSKPDLKARRDLKEIISRNSKCLA